MGFSLGEVLHWASFAEAIGVSRQNVVSVEGASAGEKLFVNLYLSTEDSQKLKNRVSPRNSMHLLENCLKRLFCALLCGKTRPLVKAAFFHLLGYCKIPLRLSEPVSAPLRHVKPSLGVYHTCSPEGAGIKSWTKL